MITNADGNTKKKSLSAFPCPIYHPKNRSKGNLDELSLGFDRFSPKILFVFIVVVV